jgi:hypothetical protein
MEGFREQDNEPSGSIKCWEVRGAVQLAAPQEVFSPKNELVISRKTIQLETAWSLK